MALQSVNVDYKTDGMRHNLVIDCGPTPIDLMVQWKRATDSTFTTLVQLAKRTGTISYRADFSTGRRDITSPPSPTLDLNSLSYDRNSKYLSFEVERPEADEGTLIHYKVIDLTNSTQIDMIPAYITSGIDGIVVKVDTKSSTLLTNQDPVTQFKTQKHYIDQENSLNYIHIAARDKAGNMSGTLREEIDLIPPTKDNNFQINEIRVAVNNQTLRFNTNSISVSVSGASHSRGVPIIRDIRLINADTREALADYKGLREVTNFNLGVNPFNNPKINQNTRLQIISKTYTSLGSTLGEETSKTFRVDLSAPAVDIEFQRNLPIFIENESYRPLHLKWTATGEMVNNVIKYRIERRSRLNSDNNWGSWQTIGESYQTDFKVPKERLIINGFNIHEFRVCGVTNNGDTQFFNYPDFIGDILPLIDTDPTSLMYFIRLPIGVHSLVDRKIILETSLDGNNDQRSLAMDYNELTGTIGNGKIDFITTGINPGVNINENGSANKANILRDIKEALAETQMDERFNDTETVTYTTDIETTSTDVFLVGYMYDDLDKLPVSLTYTKNPTNPFRHDTRVNITSSLKIKKNSDNSEELGIDVNMSNHLLAKYDTLYPPILEFAEDYASENDDPTINEFKPPIKLKASLDGRNNSLPSQYTSINVNYVRSTTLDYEMEDDFDLSKSLTKVGTYMVFARAVYNDGIGTIHSEEAMLTFNIMDVLSTYVVPTINIDNSTNIATTGSYIGLSINTNVEPSTIDSNQYMYYVKNKTNNKSIRLTSTNSTFSTDSYSNRVIYFKVDTSLLNYGTNDTVLEVYFEGEVVTYNIGMNLLRPIADPEVSNNLLGSLKRNVPDNFNVSSKYNNAWVDTSLNLDPKNNMVIFNVNGKNRALLPKYRLPFFTAVNEMTAKKYSTPNSLRNKIEDISNSFSGHVVETQTINTSLQDDRSTPPVPSITVYSSKPLTPFSSTGQGDSLVLDSISFTVDNSDTDYTSNMYIDGKPYVAGTSYTTSGKHQLMVIFTNTYNYKISHRTVDFEIKKPSMYYPAYISFTPNKKWENQYNLEIDWFVNDQEKAMGSDIRVEYTTSLNSAWKLGTLSNGKTNYTEDLSSYSGANYRVTARKTYPDGYQVERSFNIPIDYYKRTADVPSPNIDFNVSDLEKNDSVYVPAIDKHPDYTYEWKLNGLPYKEGTPITNYEHSKTSYTLDITVKDRYSTKQRNFSKTFVIDTIPPLKPLLANYDDNKLIHEVDDFYSIDIANKESGVDYTILLDGKKISEGSAITSIPYDEMNGTHTIVIHGKKRSNQMVNFSQYIFFINNDPNTTSKFHTKEVASIDNQDNEGKELRLAIVPLARQVNVFDTPGELVMDKNTGDLSIVTEKLKSDGSGYEVEDVTKDLKLDIRKVSNETDQLRKSLNIYNDKLRALEFPPPYLEDVNDELAVKTNRLSQDITALNNDLDTVKNDLLSNRTSINTLQSTFNTLVSSQNLGNIDYSGLQSRINQYPAKKSKILSDHEKHLDLMSMIAKIQFNLKNIDIVVNPKVSKTAFNDFKAKHQGFYNDLRSKINNF